MRKSRKLTKQATLRKLAAIRSIALALYQRRKGLNKSAGYLPMLYKAARGVYRVKRAGKTSDAAGKAVNTIKVDLEDGKNYVWNEAKKAFVDADGKIAASIDSGVGLYDKTKNFVKEHPVGVGAGVLGAGALGAAAIVAAARRRKERKMLEQLAQGKTASVKYAGTDPGTYTDEGIRYLFSKPDLSQEQYNELMRLYPDIAKGAIRPYGFYNFQNVGPVTSFMKEHPYVTAGGSAAATALTLGALAKALKGRRRREVESVTLKD